MPASVHYQRHDDIGVIRIDNPPVNALGHAVRSGLLEALDQGQADDGARALVLMADGRTFIAGADIREFGQPPRQPLLPEVIARLEASTKPLVAVLHGTALGGGLEVALGCHYRVALPGTRVGLPEVKLGLLPGAGGTQRLPRLVGVDSALDLITSGRFVAADEALTLGIIDAIDQTDVPLDAGLGAARAILEGQRTARRTGELPAPAADPGAIARHRARLEAEVPDLFSPFRCLEAVAASTENSLAEGLRRERELFLACMDSPQRTGLIHAFFAARAPHRVPDAGEPPALTRIALVGEHPLFERLEGHAGRTGIEFTDRPDASTQACLIAPRDAPPDCPAACLRIALQPAEADGRPDELDADLVLVTPPQGALLELVAIRASAEQQQATADALKALRQAVVVSRRDSLLAALYRAANASPDDRCAAMEAASLPLAEQGLCYRTGDIDLLAIEALGYPRHLGGPHRQATLTGSATSETSP
ncbi:enoyl-CoA hydratase/isomerase family protein [Halomonas heilongjiangensis]|uniref:Enoyl-CoA hydratase/isomerase family protein n=1 Tax=Halomonas heilongjiangensis TaxID=1387883 RepID=A0A2N7TI55_9GAMM|nr:enoyl-CoA hydratase/isomerase family protein [Halomonas heilongjiangensis]PMR67838.1 enoyl-CoA hydratase/isomerase family protein [Halomonas heilongjiangensis]PXX88857.1 3-hydroxyacyl-CoA dehydrogenase [Halomonas heilongjiangensis]